MPSQSTPRRTRKAACPHCRSIRDMLRPTMDSKRPDSVIVVLVGGVVERIYANAKKGAKSDVLP